MVCKGDKLISISARTINHLPYSIKCYTDIAFLEYRKINRLEMSNLKQIDNKDAV